MVYCSPTRFQTTCKKTRCKKFFFISKRDLKEPKFWKLCIFGRYVFRNFIFNPILMRFLFELIVLRASASMSTDFLYIFHTVFIDVIIFSFLVAKSQRNLRKRVKRKKEKENIQQKVQIQMIVERRRIVNLCGWRKVG